ncbi:MAG: nitroreductase [Spirochaetae bacterium HGW-Spirochaetae-8]|nr:MAG: nitroreductase [Spirochaetae bacterium HGW-Spirochaetae-8]
MAILPIIESRRAFRALATDPISSGVLTRLTEAAHLAPSSGNNQPWRIVTVVDQIKLEALKETLSAGNYWAKKAPAIAAFVTNPEWSMRLAGRDYAYFELGMAAMAYQLQAVEEGLRVHPIAGFDSVEAKKVLGIPELCTLEVLMVVGYPGDPAGLGEKHRELEKSVRSRKPLDQVAAFDSWNEGLLPPPKA